MFFSFPPIISGKPHTLILGTMPGQRSLKAGQYYAHPQNKFWPLMGTICGFSPDLPYEERALTLTRNGFAIWDVVRCCKRSGSMDANIRNEVVNDFAALYKEYPSIKRVIFDSIKAEQLYMRYVLPQLDCTLRYYRVPSPSPAYAKMSYGEKLESWKRILANSL